MPSDPTCDVSRPYRSLNIIPIIFLQGKIGTGANATEFFWKKQDYCLGFIDPQSYNSLIPDYPEYSNFFVGIKFFWSTNN